MLSRKKSLVRRLNRLGRDSKPRWFQLMKRFRKKLSLQVKKLAKLLPNLGISSINLTIQWSKESEVTMQPFRFRPQAEEFFESGV